MEIGVNVAAKLTGSVCSYTLLITLYIPPPFLWSGKSSLLPRVDIFTAISSLFIHIHLLVHLSPLPSPLSPLQSLLLSLNLIFYSFIYFIPLVCQSFRWQFISMPVVNTTVMYSEWYECGKTAGITTANQHSQWWRQTANIKLFKFIKKNR